MTFNSQRWRHNMHCFDLYVVIIIDFVLFILYHNHISFLAFDIKHKLVKIVVWAQLSIYRKYIFTHYMYIEWLMSHSRQLLQVNTLTLIRFVWIHLWFIKSDKKIDTKAKMSIVLIHKTKLQEVFGNANEGRYFVSLIDMYQYYIDI